MSAVEWLFLSCMLSFDGLNLGPRPALAAKDPGNLHCFVSRHTYSKGSPYIDVNEIYPQETLLNPSCNRIYPGVNRRIQQAFGGSLVYEKCDQMSNPNSTTGLTPSVVQQFR